MLADLSGTGQPACLLRELVKNQASIRTSQKPEAYWAKKVSTKYS